jgi:predicted nucleic acid-binding protein
VTTINLDVTCNTIIFYYRRNDPISTVREAAKIAITKIGGDEAQGAIKVTQVLSEEMANLRKKRA